MSPDWWDSALGHHLTVEPGRPPAPGMAERRLPPLDCSPRHVGAIVLGGGLSGIAAAIRLPLEAGIADTLTIEQAHDFGGTWLHNTYPGCACDIPSALYSIEFAPNPGWTRVFAHQPEILEYYRTVARQYGLYERALLNTKVREARWIEPRQHWRIDTTAGVFTTPVFVFAPGGLHEPAIPDVPGLDTFTGTMFHTSRWNHEHRLAGARVAVVGTGASGVQMVPQIQPQVETLTLLQRTPGWVWPKPDWKTTRAERRLYRALPAVHRALRRVQFEFGDLLVRAYLRVEIARLLNLVGRMHLLCTVRDRSLRRALTPDYALGCKRVMLDNYYLRSLTRPNVEVVPHGLAEVRERSVIAADGSEHAVDTIIWATGFEHSTPPFAKLLFGREGISLYEAWGDNPRAYMGASVSGFPNAYMLWGPNVGTGGNTIMVEAQLNYICRAIQLASTEAAASLEIRSEVVDTWKAEQRQAHTRSTWGVGGCRSWYQDKVGDVYAVYGGTMRGMLARSRTVRAGDYRATPRGDTGSTPGAESSGLRPDFVRAR